MKIFKRKIRKEFFFWIVSKILKVPKGEILPLKAKILQVILFPLKSFYYKVVNPEGYDFSRNAWKIHNVSSSDHFFYEMARFEEFLIIYKSSKKNRLFYVGQIYSHNREVFRLQCKEKREFKEFIDRYLKS